jgi:hypothetical protein
MVLIDVRSRRRAFRGARHLAALPHADKPILEFYRQNFKITNKLNVSGICVSDGSENHFA